MYEQAIMQLRKLATSDNREWITRYRAICQRRDVVLAAAITSAARALLEASDFQPDPDRTPLENYPQALEHLEHYLAQSSIPLSEQQLLALLGVGALAGWSVQLEDEAHDLLVYQSGSPDLDTVVVHRLSRALDRSPDTEPLLWEHIRAAAEGEGDDMMLVLGAARSLIDEMPMNELDTAVATTIVDSIMGG